MRSGNTAEVWKRHEEETMTAIQGLRAGSKPKRWTNQLVTAVSIAA